MMIWHKYWQEAPKETDMYYIKSLTRDLFMVEGEVHASDDELFDDILLYVTEEDSQTDEYKEAGVTKSGFYLTIAGRCYRMPDKDVVYWSAIKGLKISQEDANRMYEKFYKTED